jgi:hypothetical protein
MTLHDAKRAHFKSILSDSSTPIWDVAKWRHGQRETLIHPISNGDTLTSDFNSMTQIFKDRFFNIVAGEPLVSATFQALSEVPNTSGTASTIQLWLENGEQVLLPLPAQQVNAYGCARPVLPGTMLQAMDNSAGSSPPTS